MPPPEFSEKHVWVAAATVELDVRQAKRAVLRHSIRLPQRRKIDVLEVYCFGGETEFLTQTGIRKLGDCAGTSQRVLTQMYRGHDRPRTRPMGRWIDARINTFGRQPLMDLHLERPGEEKTIRATPNHRWITSIEEESGLLTPPRIRHTYDLEPGMVLAAIVSRQDEDVAPERWRVAAVEDRHRKDEVYCATVPETGTFGLAGNIWTGNCAQCRRPWDDVYGELCIAAETNEHLRGGPIGVRAKRKHNHRCDLLGCEVPPAEEGGNGDDEDPPEAIQAAV